MCLLLDEINRRQVVGIEHGDLELLAAMVVGDDVVATRDGLWNHRKNIVFDARPRERHEWNAKNVSIRAAQLIFTDSVLRLQNIPDLLPRLFGLCLRIIKILCRDESGISEKRFEVCVAYIHSASGSRDYVLGTRKL